MESLLVGVGIYALTEGAKYVQEKLNKKISMRLLVAVLCLVAGTVYYAFSKYNPVLLQQTVEFIAGAFATSQAIFLTVDKVLPKQPLSPDPQA